MGKLKALKEQRASAYKALEQMRQECDGREFTAEEQQRWDTMLSDYDKADEAVEAEERYRQLRPDNSKNEEREPAEYRSAFNDYILNGANDISAESRAIIAQRTEAGGRENLYAGRIVHENEVVYTIRYRAGLLAGMVVKDGESLRKITSVHEEGRRWRLHLKTTKTDAED